MNYRDLDLGKLYTNFDFRLGLICILKITEDYYIWCFDNDLWHEESAQGDVD